MIFTRYRDLFDDCVPAFWPWLWLQLALLLAQKAEDGRERLIMVTWWGYVCVLALGDAPHEEAKPNFPEFSASYRAVQHARFPGDATDLVLQANALLEPQSDMSLMFAPRVHIENLTYKSFVSAPG
jgi:hypothetical protein